MAYALLVFQTTWLVMVAVASVYLVFYALVWLAVWIADSRGH